MKIGILGGAFDPPHIGHLILAEFAYKSYNLDKVVFMPYNKNYNKSPVVSAVDRLNMVYLTVEGIDYFSVDDREIRRGGVSYTIESVYEILRESPLAEIYWIVGEDAIRSLSSWKDWEKLVKLIKFIVASRGIETEIAWKENFILELKMPKLEISSSLIRKRLQEGKTIRFLVTEKVYDYIKEKALYL